MSARTAAVVQGRMGSQRLPGKVLMDLAGAPMIARVLERAAAASNVDRVVLATSTEPSDDPLAELAVKLGVPCHRGPEDDVLRRVREAAESAWADNVVRVTGDCPLLDPWVLDEVVAALLADGGCDYASNVVERSFPRGLDVEAMTIEALRRIDELATSPEAREHVTWFAYRERPDLFEIRSVIAGDDYSGLDWSVDDDADLARVRVLYERYGMASEIRPWRDLLDG